MSDKDIENEMRAVEKLAEGHRNVVAVFGQGWLGGPFRCYYFDMDLCDCTLETYIYGDREFLFDEEWHRKGLDVVVVPKDDFVFMRLYNILWIICELTEGLNFIHECKQVHRDLKPRNGIPYCICALTSNSSVLSKKQELENYRFRLGLRRVIKGGADHSGLKRYSILSSSGAFGPQGGVHQQS